jgi:hypothetical protein
MLESWIADPIACCLKCGVNAPKALVNQQTNSLHNSTNPEDPVLVQANSSVDTLVGCRHPTSTLFYLTVYLVRF